MTDDPERLLSSKGAAGAFERELLHSLRELTPPAGARDEGWQSVSRQLTFVGAASLAAAAATTTTAGAGATPTAVTVAGGTKAAVGASLKLATWKVVVGLGVLGGGVSGAVLSLRSTESAPVPVVTSDVPVQRPTAVAVSQQLAVAPARSEHETSVTQAVESSARDNVSPKRRAPADAQRVDELSLESELLVSARSQLRAGNIGQAQATLLQLTHRLPRGALMQEREVLQIELLAARGEHASAARRARVFVTAHPNSPHSAKLARFLNLP